MLPGVKEGDRVLLIWSGITPPEKLEERVHQLNSVVGPMGKVAVEHEERLKLCEFMCECCEVNYVLHCHCSRSLKFENVLGKWLFGEFNFTVWKSEGVFTCKFKFEKERIWDSKWSDVLYFYFYRSMLPVSLQFFDST